MDSAVKVAYIVLDLVIPLILGYFCRYKQYLSDKNCNRMIEFNIVILTTALSFLSFWALPLKWELMWLPFFGIFLTFIPGVTAYLLSAKTTMGSLEKGSYLASAMLSNMGTIGGICAFLLFGETAFAYVQIVSLFQNLVFFIFCFPMAQYYRQKNIAAGDRPQLSFSSLFLNRNQLPVLGLSLGIVLYLTGIPRPAFFATLFNPLVHVTAWVSLIPAGYSINFTAMKEYYRTTINILPIKFIVTPFFGCLLARDLFNEPVLLGTILILASVPTGINAIVLSRLYGLNIHLSSAAFVLTTAIFIGLVYPIIFFWFAL